MKKYFAATVVSITFLLSAASVFAVETTITIKQPTNVKIDNFGTLIGGLIGLMLVVATLFSFFYLLWGGIQWITSGGDKAGVESAQHRIQAALLGLLIVFAVWALFTVVGNFLGIPDIFKLVIPSAAG